MELKNHSSLEYHVLKVLGENSEPAGTWHINKIIREKEIHVSQATVGRVLFKLEEQGLLEKVGGQRGRRLTPLGKEHLNKLEMNMKRDDYLHQLIGSLQKDNLESAYQHIHVRKLLEPAAAREAAIHATKEDIVHMNAAINEQSQALKTNKNATQPSMNFHLYIAKACRNPILGSFIQVLIEERKNNDVIEAIGWMRNTRSEKDHEMILDAIKRHDPEASEKLMLSHLERIEDLVKKEVEQLKSDKGFS